MNAFRFCSQSRINDSADVGSVIVVVTVVRIAVDGFSWINFAQATLPVYGYR